MKKNLPLEGIRILETALQFPGPYCCMLLADLGANVLKVEKPGVGDPARHLPHWFSPINRNKKSLTLNLKAPAGKEILYRLIESYDVFTEGSRPGVASRLGMDYGTLSRRNPRLIYCSISGYGQDGPYKDLPGHDLNYQAMAGMLQFFKDGEGHFIAPGTPLGDISSAMFAALGIMAALMARDKTGHGQYVDVSMFDGLLSWMSLHLGIFFGTGKTGMDIDAGYGIFQAADGKSFALGIAIEDWFWDRFCSATGLDEYQGIHAKERRERKEELVERLRAVFVQKPKKEWMRILGEADVPVSPVHTLEEVVDDPHVVFRKIIQEMTLKSGEKVKQLSFPVKFSNTPTNLRIPPPELGEHTEEVLESLDYSKNEIERLIKEGVV